MGDRGPGGGSAGETARLAQRRGRGPGGPQSTPRNPRGNGCGSRWGRVWSLASGVYAGGDPASAPPWDFRIATLAGLSRNSPCAGIPRAPRSAAHPASEQDTWGTSLRGRGGWKIPLRERRGVIAPRPGDFPSRLLPPRPRPRPRPRPQQSPLNPSSAGTQARKVSRGERSHCPTQTVKKLLEEQRRRQQQQPDPGGVQGQFLPPPEQPLNPSVNEAVTGHPPFPAHSKTVGSGLSSLSLPMGFPDWDPNTHAAYTDSPYSCPASAAESFLPPDFYPPSDPGQPCPFPQGMEDPPDTRFYAESSLPQAGPWRVSTLPSGPPQFPAVVPGPSLEAARAHILALGPQQLLAQDEEGDT
ncbi:hypothetical protein H8959_005250 [Pygathrix nigripes]